MTSTTRLQRARIALILDEPFFGSLLMHLKPIEDKAANTFSTNGRDLRYNPQFMESLNDPELKTILAHEVLHCALLHPFRLGQRDLRKANLAADYAVNNFLDTYNREASAKVRASPFPFTGPLAGGCLDHQYDPYAFEEIYNLIQTSNDPNTQTPNPVGSLGTSSALGTSPGEFEAGAKDQAEADVQEANWKVALQQAAIAAKSQGKLPGSIARLVEELLDPKVPWREVLRTLLTSVAKNDYTWTRPNPRYASSGFILPSLHSPTLGRIAVAIDTSGSIDQKQLNEFLAEVQSILFDCRPEKLVLIQCDAKIQEVREYDTFEQLEVTMKGGGGTDFRPIFDLLSGEIPKEEENTQVPKVGSLGAWDLGICSEPPTALIYLTDLQGTFPEQAPAYPVIWCATTDDPVPFGEVVRI